MSATTPPAMPPAMAPIDDPPDLTGTGAGLGGVGVTGGGLPGGGLDTRGGGLAVGTAPKLTSDTSKPTHSISFRKSNGSLRLVSTILVMGLGRKEEDTGGVGGGGGGGQGRVGVRPRGRIFTGVDGKNPSAGKSASVG
jgi:hypothetical protein